MKEANQRVVSSARDGSGLCPIPPTVLTVAGSDSSGGAGIQADLKAIAANGGYAASVVTAITAQNTVGVHRSDRIPAEMLQAQLDAVFDDLEVRAVKTGMLGNAATIALVARALRERKPAHLVCDPVMVSKSGYALLDPAAMECLSRELLPLATLVTPNAEEASRLAGLPVRDPEEAALAGRRLVEGGARAVLVKGGHLERGRGADVLVSDGRVRTYPAAWIDSAHTHGTGCTLSAAIATWLARGLDLETAVEV